MQYIQIDCARKNDLLRDNALLVKSYCLFKTILKVTKEDKKLLTN